MPLKIKDQCAAIIVMCCIYYFFVGSSRVIDIMVKFNRLGKSQLDKYLWKKSLGVLEPELGST